MFEDSLVESSGLIRTSSRRYAAGSFALQAALLAVAVLIPYIYPAALTPHVLLTPLASPPPPTMSAQSPHAASSRSVVAVRTIDLTAPRMIPRYITRGTPTSSGPPCDCEYSRGCRRRDSWFTPLDDLGNSPASGKAGKTCSTAAGIRRCGSRQINCAYSTGVPGNRPERGCAGGRCN